MKKRIISSIMCLAMLLSLLPVSAFAAESVDALEGLEVTEAGFFATAENFKDYINNTYYLNEGKGVQDVAPNTVFVRMNKAVPEGYGLYMLVQGQKTGTQGAVGSNAKTIMSPKSFAYFANDDYAAADKIVAKIGVYPLVENADDQTTKYDPETSWNEIRWLKADGSWEKLADYTTSKTLTVEVNKASKTAA